MKRFLALAFLLLACSPAFGQSSTLAMARAVTSCGGQSLTNGNTYPLTQDLTGKLCDGSGGGTTSSNITQFGGTNVSTGTGVGGAGIPRVTVSSDSFPATVAVTQSTSPWVVSGTVTANIVPSSSSSIGITPVVSTAGEATHVLKAGAGNVYAAYASNLTATNGFLLLLNSTSAPVDGAVTPLACAPLSANGVASINYAPGPPGVFSTGITAVVTSATTCFTKTTGVITAFISGSVQ